MMLPGNKETFFAIGISIASLGLMGCADVEARPAKRPNILEPEKVYNDEAAARLLLEETARKDPRCLVQHLGLDQANILNGFLPQERSEQDPQKFSSLTMPYRDEQVYRLQLIVNNPSFDPDSEKTKEEMATAYLDCAQTAALYAKRSVAYEQYRQYKNHFLCLTARAFSIRYPKEKTARI